MQNKHSKKLMISIVAFTWIIVPISRASSTELGPVPPTSDYAFESKEPHELQLITSGPLALKTYLDQIESAQSSVDLESFVLRNDATGALVLDALMKKARRGIKVRVLLDTYGSKILNSSILTHLKEAGVELKYYHPSAKNTFSIPMPLDHRKLLVIDGKRVMAGGRNFSTDNFQTTENKRLDYSFILEGPLVPQVQSTFDRFWNSPMSQSIPVSSGIRALPWQLSPSRTKLLLQLDRLSKKTTQSFIVSDLKFVSDSPDIKGRYFLHELLAKLKSVKNSVRVESPSYHFSHYLDDSLQELVKQNKDVTLMVGNPSPNQGITSLVLLLFGAEGTEKTLLNRIQTQGAKVLYLNQNTPSEDDLCPQLEPLLPLDFVQFAGQPKNTSITNHGKTIIFDDQDVFLGSFNFDVLSEIHNAEAGFYFKNSPELATYLKDLQQKRNYRFHDRQTE